jgi:outer membrane lipoprotein carrier protein
VNIPFLCVALLVGVTSTHPNPAEIIRRLESHYHGAETLQAEFLERYSEGRRSVHIESGRVFFRRPGQMRWEYEVPEKKLFIADGKFVWFYVPSDRTVTRARTKESGDWRTPLGLLTGNAKLSRLCQGIELVPRASNHQVGHAVLHCTPRERRREKHSEPAGADGESAESEFDEVLLEVDEKTGDLASVLVRQPGGVEIEYRFAHWHLNPRLSEALFKFVAPTGVTIVDEGAVPGTHRQDLP